MNEAQQGSSKKCEFICIHNFWVNPRNHFYLLIILQIKINISPAAQSATLYKSLLAVVDNT